jgi:HEAT repeat protein
LKGPSAKRREAAARAIGQIGEGAKAALGPMLAAARGPDAAVRAAAVLALNQLPDDPKAVPALAAALNDDAPGVRINAAQIARGYLRDVPKDARKPAKAPLLKALKGRVTTPRSRPRP